MAGVDHKAIINGGEFGSANLAKKLTAQSFECGELTDNGFSPQAAILVLEYFAYESIATAPLAKQLMRTFGTIGLMETLQKLKKEQPTNETRQLPQRDTIDYIEAAKAIPTLAVNPLLKQLLEDSLTDELELMRNRKLLGDGKAEYTIAKERAKELGYTLKQIGSGSALGIHVAKHLKPDCKKRIGEWEVNHYRITSQLDEVIHAYFR